MSLALYKEIKDVVVSQVTKMTDLEVVEVKCECVDIKRRNSMKQIQLASKTE